MPLYKNKYRIESTRLKDWDYSSNGYYYVTICTKNRENFFGEIKEGEMILSKTGMIADKFWCEIPDHFPFVILDEYIIMPNHIHGIIQIDRDGDTQNRRKDTINRVFTNTSINDTMNTMNTKKGGITKKNNPMLNPFSLSKIIRWFKGRVSFEINKSLNNLNFAWQSRFYDHIIRDEEDLTRIRDYIKSNPLNWNNDEENKKNNDY